METWKQAKRKEKLGLGVRAEKPGVWPREPCVVRPETIRAGTQNIDGGRRQWWGKNRDMKPEVQKRLDLGKGWGIGTDQDESCLSR